MATDIMFKTMLKRGPKGATGTSINFEVPTGSIIAYDGDDIPEGWELSSKPEGAGAAIYQTYIENTAIATNTITANGEVTI